MTGSADTLKADGVATVTVAFGRLFQMRMLLGYKENLKASIVVDGIRYLN